MRNFRPFLNTKLPNHFSVHSLFLVSTIKYSFDISPTQADILLTLLAMNLNIYEGKKTGFTKEQANISPITNCSLFHVNLAI